MNCLFCHQETKLVYQEEGAPAEEASSLISCQTCESCQTNFYFDDEKMKSYCIRYNEYRAWFYLYISSFELDKLPLNDLPIQSILYLTFLPSLTPQNIAIRLPIFLLFL